MGKFFLHVLAAFLLFSALAVKCTDAVQDRFHSEQNNGDQSNGRSAKGTIHFTAVISEFYFKIGSSSQPVIQKVLLGSLGHVANDVAADATTQQFPLSETVTQTVNFSIARGYTYMDSVDVDFRATVSGEAGVPLVLEPRIWEGISDLYQYPNPDYNTSALTVSTQTSVQSSQEITVPACHTCHLNAFVNQAVNYPIKYATYANVQASRDKEPMTAAELRANLPPGVDYIKAADEYTVVAVTKGTMYVQYGVDTFIETECKRLFNCPPHDVSTEITKPLGSQSTEQGRSEIGSSMGKESNWNSLSESSFPY